MKINRQGQFLFGAMLVLGVSFIGCKVGPDYTAPPVYVPVSYTQIDPERGVSEHPCADLRDWWAQMDDPVLSQLINEGIANNYTLREAAMRVLENRAAVGISDSALFPWFSGDGGFSRNYRNKTGYDNWNLGMNMTWEIDVFGRLQRLVEAAEADVDVTTELYHNTYTILLADIATEYVNARAYQQQITITEQNIAIRKRTLEMTEDKFRSGIVSQLDVSQAKGSYEAVCAELPAMRSNLRQSLNRLSVLLGNPPGHVDALMMQNPSPIPEAPSEILVGIPAELIRRRPDVRAAEQQVIAQTARIGAAIGDLYPMFSINGSFGVDATDFSKMFKSGAVVAGVGPSFQWNILNFGRYRSNIRMQELMQKEYVLTYQRTVLEAAEDVDNALASYVNEKERLVSLTESVNAYDLALNLSEERYRRGTEDFQRVLDSQREKLSFETQRTASQANAINSVIQLYRALGGSWMSGAPMGPMMQQGPEGDPNAMPQAPVDPNGVQPLPVPVPPAANNQQPIPKSE